MFFKIVLKIFENFTSNTCVGVFSIKLLALRPADSRPSDPSTRVFSCEISQILKNIFLTVQLRCLLLKTAINCNTKFF